MRGFSAFSSTLTIAGLLVLASGAEAATVEPLPRADYSVRAACPPPKPHQVSCLAQELVPQTTMASARTHPLGFATSHVIAAGNPSEGAYGLRPQDLRNAYFPGEQPDAPVAEPQTIAIVGVYNDLQAEADLKVFDHEFDLPECAATNGCLTQLNEDGEPSNLPFPSTGHALEEGEAACTSSGEGESIEEAEAREALCLKLRLAGQWSKEISLDLQVAHGICQNCHILLVEASDPELASIEVAEDTAAQLGATVISNSLAGEEPLADSEAFDHPGIVITAASGDSGYLNWNASKLETEEGIKVGDVNYPASSPRVVAVGGTRLALNKSGAWESETVWRGGGSGCSPLFPAPAWQQGLGAWPSVGCEGQRALVDISADADPYTGVAIYDSFPEVHKAEGGRFILTVPGWHTSGGTSLASPLVAGLFALAGGAHGVAFPAETLYAHLASASLHDVAAGSDGKCDGNYSSGCTGSMSPPSLTDCGEGVSICNSQPGYDGPSGVGTPDGLNALRPSPPGRGSGGLEAPVTESCGQPSGTLELCGTLNPNSSAKTGYYFAFNFGPSCVGGKQTPLMPEVEGEDIHVSSTELFGLQPDARYSYCVVASNTNGEAAGSTSNFTTAPRTPETHPAINVASESATLDGKLKTDTIPTSWHFTLAPGIGCAGGAVTPERPQGAVGEEVQAEAIGLQPSTIYTACLVASNPGGSTVGSLTTFKTLPAKPTIVSESALTESTAVAALAGVIKPGLGGSHYEFEYGPTAAYGLTTVGGDLRPTDGELSAGPELVTGLTSGTTYHYRLTAVNASGETHGEDRTFTMLGGSQEPPPIVPPPETQRLFHDLSVAATRRGRSIRVHLAISVSGSQLAVAIFSRVPSTATARPWALGHVRRTGLASGPALVTVPLNPAGRRMLGRRGFLEVKISIVVTAPTGSRSNAERSLRLTAG